MAASAGNTAAQDNRDDLLNPMSYQDLPVSRFI
jgi:hypothetical protein